MVAAELIGQFKPWVGKSMSWEFAEALRLACEEVALANKKIACVAERKPGFGGWVVTVKPLEKRWEPCDGWTGLVCEEGRIESFTCELEVEREPPPHETYRRPRSDTTPTHRARFEQAAREITDGTTRAHSAAILKFTTQQGETRYHAY